MRIGPVRADADGATVRAEANVVWEDSDRGAVTLSFEVVRSGRPAPIDPNAFLAAAAIPALRHGERRIAVDGSVCPRLRDGLEAAGALLGSWYGRRPVPAIEPSGGFVAPRPPSPPRAATFLSGGLDSTWGVWWNRRYVPADHPRAFREALRIRHLMYPVDSAPDRRAHIERRSRNAAEAIARDAGLDLVEVGTNATRLEDDYEGFAKWTHGSVLAACGIAAGAPLTDLSIAASHDVRNDVLSWGSHPLLDPLFSTAALAIHHDGIEASRLDKATAVGGWKTALDSLYVCEAGPFDGDAVNCGRCEKCVRTRVALLVGPGIAEPPTFPPEPLTAATIAGMPPLAGFRRLSYYWPELAEGTRRIGRSDLAAAIDRLVDRQKRIESWAAGRGWKGAIRRFDERHFGSALLRVRRWVSR